MLSPPIYRNSGRSSNAVETDQPGKDREPRWADHAAHGRPLSVTSQTSAEVGQMTGMGRSRPLMK